MTFNIKLEIIDISIKYRFYEKIYFCLSEYGNYSGTILVSYLNNTYDEIWFTYINDPSITISVLDYKSDKSECDIEHLYYIIRSIIRESDNDILDIELKFTKK
jgi:hypothetical protein